VGSTCGSNIDVGSRHISTKSGAGNRGFKGLLGKEGLPLKKKWGGVRTDRRVESCKMKRNQAKERGPAGDGKGGSFERELRRKKN